MRAKHLARTASWSRRLTHRLRDKGTTKGRLIMLKIVATVSTVLVSLGLAAFVPAQPPPDGPPFAKAKVKGKEGKNKAGRQPGGDLRKAYDLLRRLRADESALGRPDERLRDWTDRATGF